MKNYLLLIVGLVLLSNPKICSAQKNFQLGTNTVIRIDTSVLKFTDRISGQDIIRFSSIEKGADSILSVTLVLKPEGKPTDIDGFYSNGKKQRQMFKKMESDTSHIDTFYNISVNKFTGAALILKVKNDYMSVVYMSNFEVGHLLCVSTKAVAPEEAKGIEPNSHLAFMDSLTSGIRTFLTPQIDSIRKVVISLYEVEAKRVEHEGSYTNMDSRFPPYYGTLKFSPDLQHQIKEILVPLEKEKYGFDVFKPNDSDRFDFISYDERAGLIKKNCFVVLISKEGLEVKVPFTLEYLNE